MAAYFGNNRFCLFSLLLHVILLLWCLEIYHAFLFQTAPSRDHYVQQLPSCYGNQYRQIQVALTASITEDDNGKQDQSKQMFTKGDPIRAATGIRPSLHPTTINAISDALKARAGNKDGDMVFTVSDTVQPIDVAMTAGKIASTAISKRQEASKKDDNTMTLTSHEEQTIAGRIMGVVMRLEELETILYEKVTSVTWIAQYDEWNSFGLLPQEKDNDDDDLIHQRIREDPLFCLCRAECLLGLFLHSVEKPQLQQKNETVPDDSKIDFLDVDRMDVLLT